MPRIILTLLSGFVVGLAIGLTAGSTFLLDSTPSAEDTEHFISDRRSWESGVLLSCRDGRI